MKINIKRSTCDKINPILSWLLVLSIIFKAINDIWGQFPVKIDEDTEKKVNDDKLEVS